MINRAFATLIFSLFIFQIIAQLPASDVYLFTYHFKGDSLFLTESKYLTQFNEGQYNNQPNFHSYNDLYITSYNKEEAQTDLIRFDLMQWTKHYFTQTSESEYSPTPTPDHQGISCIKVLNDEHSSQLLWRYPKSQKNLGAPIFKDLFSVGYHCWLSNNEVAMFLVGEPHQLAIGNVETEEVQIITENIGRTLKKTKTGKLLYIHKASEENWTIKEYDPLMNQAKIVAPCLPQIEDFDLLSNGTLVSGIGSKLYRWTPEISSEWMEVADLSSYGIMNIGRIDSEFDRLSIVDRKQ